MLFSLPNNKLCYFVEIKGGLIRNMFRGDVKAQPLGMARFTLLLLGGFYTGVSQKSELTSVALSILLGVG